MVLKGENGLHVVVILHDSTIALSTGSSVTFERDSFDFPQKMPEFYRGDIVAGESRGV